MGGRILAQRPAKGRHGDLQIAFMNKHIGPSRGEQLFRMHEGAVLLGKSLQDIHRSPAKPNFGAPAEQLAMLWVKPERTEGNDVALLFQRNASSTGVVLFYSLIDDMAQIVNELSPNHLIFLHYYSPGPAGVSHTPHSHSIVPGGFDVTSYTTRLIPRTSLMIRVATFPRKPMSKGKKSAVMPSTEVTARSAQTWS